MESKYRNVRNKNRWMIGGTRDTDSVAKELTEALGGIIIFALMGILAIAFLAISGCSGSVNKMNTVSFMEDGSAKVTVPETGGKNLLKSLGEPFKKNGETQIVTLGKSVNLQMAINIAKMEARGIIGRSKVMEQNIMMHPNGVQYLALVTSQKL